MYDPSGGYPDLARIRTEIGVGATIYDDERLSKAAGSQQENLSANYDFGTALPDAGYVAFIRGVGRTVAADGVRLGILAADAEYGTVRLTTKDSELTRLLGMYRKRTFA